jgi:hypothetical protein
LLDAIQIFVGGCTMMLISGIISRARGDREHLPAPAPASIADVPAPFLQGLRKANDILRELRDLTRCQTEDTGRIAECVRIIREETVKHTSQLSCRQEREVCR